MLVVISIIGMLAALIVPAAIRARENANRTKCANNLHQIVLAMAAYEAKHRTLPPGRVGCDCAEPEKGIAPCRGMPAYKRPGTSGFALILPELDELTIYQKFCGFQRGAVWPGDQATSGKSVPTADGKSTTIVFPESSCDDSTVKNWKDSYATIGVSGQSARVATAIVARPSVYVCPSDLNGYSYYGATIDGETLGGGTTSYAMSMGSSLVTGYYYGTLMSMDKLKYANNGAFIYRFPRNSSAITDGMANTIFVGEIRAATSTYHNNRWAAAWRFTDSLRSTVNGINWMIYHDGSSWQQWSTISGDNDSSPVWGAFASYHGTGMNSSQWSVGANFAFGDGHVQFLKNSIEIYLFRALSTIANGATEGAAGYVNPPED